MKIIIPSYEIIYPVYKREGEEMVRQIERAARCCYKSEQKSTSDGQSAIKLVTMLRDNGHEAMLEFGGNITVKIIADRGFLAEITRHRLASFAVESSRYVSYKEGIEVICPDDINNDEDAFSIWLEVMEASEKVYKNLIELGYKPQIARSVLPTALKTEINISANIREFRHIFKLRTSKAAHPQMRELMIPLLKELKEIIPVVFDDIEVE